MIRVLADFEPLIEGSALLAKQLPFAIARTLTTLAGKGQESTRDEIESGIFQLRNDWTRRNVKITPATKASQTAEVYTDTSNWATKAPDYLEGQEEGKNRVPVNGRQHIAIPTKYLVLLNGGPNRPIPDWLRPRALLALAESGGKHTNRRGREVRGNGQTRGYYFFKVTFKSGATGIMCRAVTDAPNAAVPLYIFVSQASIRKRLHMAEDVDKAVADNLAEVWDRVSRDVLLSDAIRELGFRF